MTINKFQGKTEQEAVEKARKEMGQNAVIMNVRQIKPRGFLAGLKGPTYEVTAAIEEREQYRDPVPALKTPLKMHDNISVAADEQISLPPLGVSPAAKGRLAEPKIAAEPPRTNTPAVKEQADAQNSEELKGRLENLQKLLEEKLPQQEQKKEAPEEKPIEAADRKSAQSEEFRFLKTVYGILLDNEVDEKYVNEILDEVEKVARHGNGVDLILSNIYQKMILKFGTPKTIELTGKKPKVVFFIGPTGVGKTTTIAKVASAMKVDHDKKVAFLTADTYRIAATEQLRTYANILDAPLTVIYSPQEMNDAVERVKAYDLVLVDTAGFSHKSDRQREETRALMESLDPKYEREIYLVLSATTKYKDLLEIVDIYHEMTAYKLIFTKLDETSTYGNLMNIKLYSGADISYVTTGQTVPDDIEVFHTQRIVKQLLGGK
ncbi:MAG: flagellar biosynthesis protein FlhF [Lachnospiraceae bacterium]|nr:flagellar biosynthesis protein FlhF [Lachnospiraceae bacterium]